MTEITKETNKIKLKCYFYIMGTKATKSVLTSGQVKKHKYEYQNNTIEYNSWKVSGLAVFNILKQAVIE